MRRELENLITPLVVPLSQFDVIWNPETSQKVMIQQIFANPKSFLNSKITFLRPPLILQYIENEIRKCLFVQATIL